MFKLFREDEGFTGEARYSVVQRISDNASIPLTMENRDCQDFVLLWAAGDPVFEPDGVTPFPDTPANRALLGLP